MASSRDTPVRLFSDGKYSLNLSMWVLEDPTNSLTIDQVVSRDYQGQFIKNTSKLPNFGVSKNTYWIQVTLLYPAMTPNTLEKRLWYLEVAKSLINIAELYTPMGNGVYDVKTADMRIDWEQRELKHIYSVFPVTTYLDEELTLYLKLKNASSLQVPLTLWSQSAFAGKVAIEEFLYGVFFGGMVIMLLYNVFVYVAVRDVAYVYYVLYLGWVTYFELVEVGHGIIHVDFLYTMLDKSYIPLMVLCSLGSAVLFARTFLETRQRNVRLDIVFILMFWVILISILLSFFIDYQTGILWVTTLSSCVLTYLICVSCYCWLAGNNNAKFFFVAWVFNGVGFITFSLMVNQVIPSTPLTVMSAPLGVFFEAIMLSFALANRIKEAEKDALNADKLSMLNLAHYRSAFNNALEGFYQMTLSGVIKSANPAMLEIMDMIATNDARDSSREVAMHLYQGKADQMRELKNTGVSESELHFVNDKKRNIWVIHRARLIYDDTGNASHIEGTVVEVTEEKEKELAIKNEASERISKEVATIAAEEKKQLLSMMNHEIRTPLTAIIAYSEFLQENEDENDKKECVEAVIDNSRKLLHIVNNILDLSKLEASKVIIEKVAVDVIGIVSKVSDDFSTVAKSKGIQCFLHFSYPLPNQVLSDPFRIEQVVRNLLDNAIRFTNAGKVCISVSWSDARLEISVLDTGIGISDDDREKLFDLSDSGETLRRSTISGAGLGLPISKKLAVLMGGDLVYRKNSVGGSIFTFTALCRQSNDMVWIKKSPQRKRTAKKVAGSSKELNGVVLVAEDNIVNQKLISKLLKNAGLTVVLACDGVEACELIEDDPPDLVLMDIHMPKRNGIEAVEILRGKGHQMPIIALTAETDKTETDKAINAGCQEVLGKPINREGVISAMQSYLGDKEGG